jgi:hypothetical protein
MNNNIIETFDDEPATLPPIIDDTYTLSDGTDLTILSNNSREIIKDLLEKRLKISNDDIKSLRNDNIFYNLKSNEMDVDNRTELYKAFEFTPQNKQNHPKINRVLQSLKGTYTLNIEECIKNFGDKNQSGYVRCTEFQNDKTKALTIWLLSSNNENPDINRHKNHSNELRCKCKKPLCYNDHVENYAKTPGYNEWLVLDKAHKLNDEYYNDFLKKTEREYTAGMSFGGAGKVLYTQYAGQPRDSSWFEFSNDGKGTRPNGLYTFNDYGVNDDDDEEGNIKGDGDDINNLNVYNYFHNDVVIKKNLDTNNWYSNYYITSNCLGCGISNEDNIFGDPPFENIGVDVPLFTLVQKNTYSSTSNISWYIDYSKASVSIIMKDNIHGIIIFYQDNDISNSNIAFYVDFYIVDADTEGEDRGIYAVLHRSSSQRYFRNPDFSHIVSSNHESCICKIYLDRYNNIVISDNILFPSVVLKNNTPFLGCSPCPRSNSLLAFKIFLYEMGRFILNTEKNKNGYNFEIIPKTNDTFALRNNIKNIIIQKLEQIYEIVFDYLPDEINPKTCSEAEHSETPEVSETTESDVESTFPDTIIGKINNFLYVHCDGKSTSDEVEKGKFTAYLLNDQNNNKFNSVKQAVDTLYSDEDETVQFCSQTNLGTVTPSDDLKNTAIHHTLLLNEVSNGSLPLVSDEFSEESFNYLCTDSTCTRDISNPSKRLFNLTSYPEGEEDKYCGQNNFSNSDEILGKCNYENKNLLEEICRSYGAPIGGSGYPEYRCKIEDLNNLINECNEIEIDCNSNPPEEGCDRISPRENKPLKSYPKAYSTEDGTVIEVGGICSNYDLFNREIESIDDMNTVNEETLERHTNIRNDILGQASLINLGHIALSMNHENNLKEIEDRNEDTTKMRLCNAQKRKYDFENNLCTDEFLELNDIETNPRYNQCELDRLNKEKEIKFKLYMYLIVFLIIFALSFYFIFLR